MTLKLTNPENPPADIKLTLCIHLPTCGLPMYIVEDIDAALKWYVEGTSASRDYVNLDMLSEARDGLVSDYSTLLKCPEDACNSWRRIWPANCQDARQTVAHMDSLIAALENPAAFSVEG